MLIENYKEIYNLAWLDSDYFDKEGFLLVKDNTTTDQLTYVERFCRLKGNLLFILKIPNLDIELNDLTDLKTNKLNYSSQNNQLDDKITNNSRIKLLNKYYRRKSFNNDTLSTDQNSLLIYVLILNDYGLRRCEDENSRDLNGFIIEFYNLNDYTNHWYFQCLTIDERDCWIDFLNRSNYLNLKSIFNLLLERKINLIKQREKRFIENFRFEKSENNYSELNNSSNQLINSTSSNNLICSSSSFSNADDLEIKKSNSISSSLSILSNNTTSTKKLSFSKLSTTVIQLNASNNLINQINQIKLKDGLKTYFLTDSYFKLRNSLDKLTASYSFKLSIDLQKFKLINFEPNIFIKVYCSLNCGIDWSVLGRTETLKIFNPLLPNPSHLNNIDHKFTSYLDESDFDNNNLNKNSEIKFAKKFYLNLYEKIELDDNLQKIIKFDLDNNKILLKFNIYNLVEAFTGRFILIGSCIDYFKQENYNLEIFSSIHYRTKQIGQLKMTTLENDLNIYQNNQQDLSSIKHNNHQNDTEYSNDNQSKKHQQQTKFYEFDSLIEPQLFVNTIHRSFQFELNQQQKLTIININELMSEPVSIFTLVQDLMNIFMDDEKKLMNAITYSLGEVKQEYQRRQMQVLESHLRLVNLITESINSLNQIQTGTKFFRQSVQKNEVFFQFVPLNLHLQKTIFNKQANRSNQVLKRLNQSNLETYDILNIYTHGSFSAHRLGFDNGGLQRFINEIEQSTKETNYNHLNNIWLAMRNYFKIVYLSKQITEFNDKLIDLTLKLGKQTDLKLAKNSEYCDDFQKLKIDLQSEATQQLLRDKIYCQKYLFKLFGKIEECCKEITKILDPKQVETTLSYLDSFRAQHLLDDQEGEEQLLEINEDNLTADTIPNNREEKPKESLTKSAANSLKSSVLSTMKSTMKFNLINNIKSNNSKSMHSSFKSHLKPAPIIKSGMTRTISLPLDKIQSSNDLLKKSEDKIRKLQRHNSEIHIDNVEFEPVELIHLNIRASLISMQSKLNQFINLNLDNYKDQKFNFSSIYEKIVNEMRPSTKKLFSSIDSLMKTSSICYAIESLRLSKDQSEYFYLIRSRRNMVFSQILTTFTIALMGELTSIKLNKNNDDNLNFLNNNDINNFSDTNSNYLEKLFEQRQIVCFFEGLLSSYAEEIGMIQDMQYAIKELNSVEVLFVNLFYDAGHFKKFNLNNQSDKLLNNGIFNMPKFEGNGYNIKLTIPFYDENLPEEFKCNITALFFNIGINESATLAETIGHVKIQDELNKKSFDNLENFITLHGEIKNKNLIDNLTALKTELYSNRAKNVRILYLTEQIAYDLNAIRFTNCKSGKDRTAMSCTLEQIRKCGKLFNFDELDHNKLFQQMLDTLRSEGVRRENTRKNINAAYYAFNSLQVLTLPSLYRPPAGTYSNNVKT